MLDLHWRELAVCRGLPVEEQQLFFGEVTDSDLPSHTQHDLAKLYCYTCPAQIDCLVYASAHPVDGVWGGLTESQRKRYLAPALRIRGKNRAVYASVILVVGEKIIKRLVELEAEMDQEEDVISA